jgi:hypothetical protein
MTSPLILIPKVYTKLEQMAGAAWGGRKKGTTGGSLVGDMVQLRKTIILCGSCQHKFDWRHNNYFSVWRYEHQPVVGECDVCKLRITGNDGRLFLHEASRHNVWATKDEQRSNRSTMVRVAHSRYT